jgi:glyoxylase-like metal-dependent hydrolase (beta-lactamase superfamily II)/rhodanese-related sulfurtransferase
MIFKQFANGGCQSYLIGCERTGASILIDPEIHLIERYRSALASEGLRLRYLIDTHTHADHFSAAREMGKALDAAVVLNRISPAPYADIRLDDGESLVAGDIRLVAMHTPGHTRDSMCLMTGDAVFTGDTLLIGGTGRTDLPTGDPEALFDSLFGRLLKQDRSTRVYPGHDYHGRQSSTIGDEIEGNPRLQKSNRADFVTMMRELNLAAPTHLTEALRTNMSGGRTVEQLLNDAASKVAFLSLTELHHQLERGANDLVILDVREKDAFEQGHIPGARHLARGQLELRVNDFFPDPTVRVLTCCEFGKISTLAAATLKQLGFRRAIALDGGVKAWREAGYEMEV